MKVAVLLSGSGVYDGSELQESVLSLYFLDKAGITYQCVAPNVNQFHVINHLKGEPMEGETRNVLTEAARIARGNILAAEDFDLNTVDGLLMPGGFGNAKNLTDWAFKGPDGEILPSVKKLILGCLQHKKPICALCVSPVVLAKAAENSPFHLQLTLGTDAEPSPYNINDFNAGIEKTGASAVKKGISEVLIDAKHKVVTSPCYMQEVSIAQVGAGIEKAVAAFADLLKNR